ncbi:hypothetical protein HYW21_06550 [Candidatus Woesearchaeota archaeon]|nr:hypothetical protein [Candidatus Woesearchaeota archaeon]
MKTTMEGGYVTMKNNTMRTILGIILLLIILPTVLSFSGQGNNYDVVFTLNSFVSNSSSYNGYSTQLYGSKFPSIQGSGSGYNLLEGSVYFKKIAAENVSLAIDNTTVFSERGVFRDPVTVQGIAAVLQDYLTYCSPDDQGYCLVPFLLFSATPADLKLYNLEITTKEMNAAPRITVTLIPENPGPDDDLVCSGQTYDLNDDLLTVYAQVLFKKDLVGFTEQPLRQVPCVKIGSPGKFVCNTTISASITQERQEVTCTMQAFDGDLTSDWETDTVIIGALDDADDTVEPLPSVVEQPQDSPEHIISAPENDSRDYEPLITTQIIEEEVTNITETEERGIGKKMTDNFSRLVNLSIFQRIDQTKNETIA